jgi:hypothetical protein
MAQKERIAEVKERQFSTIGRTGKRSLSGGVELTIRIPLDGLGC